VFDLEKQLGIEERWTEDSPGYKCYREQVSQQEYHAALSELERLVVQQLFELSKLGMSGTGRSLNVWHTVVANYIQDINSVVRSERHCNVDQKPYELP
jgi:hypothetical protein